MTGAFIYAVEGLDAIGDIESLAPEILLAARQAVNKTTERARAVGARRIREQVNFPARYLSDAEGRLSIVKRASGSSLEGVVRGRHRATSLARFISSGKVGQAGVRVAVKPGGARFMKRAFLIKLKAGSASIDTQSNLGLAVRTDGAKPAASYKPVKISKNLWLLYGASVDQVFKSVAEDITPETGDFLEAEFLRLLELRK